MATELYLPKLDQFYLDIIDISDTHEFSIITHEYPNSNVNILENTGAKTKKIAINCVFGGEKDDETGELRYLTLSNGWPNNTKVLPLFETHYLFLDHIYATNALFTFSHPNYGEIKGKISNIKVTADDTVNFVKVSFEFIVENSVEKLYAKGVTTSTTENYVAVVNESKTQVLRDFANSISPTKWAADANIAIGKLDALFGDIVSPADSILNTIYLSQSLSDQLIYSISSAIDRLVQVFSVITAPKVAINNIVQGVRQMGAQFTGLTKKYVYTIGSARAAVESGKLYELDNSNDDQNTSLENERSFDINGNFMGSKEFVETMSINELEETLYNIRALIDESIQEERDNYPLKRSGMELQNYINNIKLTRESIVTKENVTTQSMHQLVVSEGLSYHQAEKILKLNPSIKNPTFSEGTLKVLSKTQ
ncbi:MAG TPA: hypothetical protein VMX17_16000 [Candidatus Glassbacteria bacterium]|nr:hypothetical protein [Candidatus Glassbacteria bacterium]